MGSALPYHGCSSGLNTDAQERRGVKEYRSVELLCLMGTLRVSGTQSTEEVFCNSLLAHFGF